MNKAPGSLFFVVAVLVMAIEKPTSEYQDLMRSNASVVDLSVAGNGESVENSIDGKGNRPSTLRAHLKAKDYDAAVKDAELLSMNYEKLQAFWSARKADDALGFIKTGLQAAADVRNAAQAKSEKDAFKAMLTLEATCRSCHLAHRVVMLTNNSFQIN